MVLNPVCLNANVRDFYFMEVRSVDRNLQLANEAFKKEQWQQAAQFYEQEYQSAPSEKINHLLVKSLFEDHQYKMAYTVMMDNLNSYLMDGQHVILMVRVLLVNHQLLMAHVLTATVPRLPAEVGQLLFQAEEEARQKPGFRKDYQTFYQLSALTLNQQQQAFEKGKQLPLGEWVTATKALLIDPFVKPIIRVSLLEMVQKLKLKERFTFRWLDNKNYEVAGNQLKSLAEVKKVGILERTLQAMLGDHDPMTQQLYQNELGLQVTLLYPFIDRAIPDPQAWVTRLIQGDQEQSAALPTAYSVEWWQRKLSQIMSEMTGT
ncbi:hypothetical protein IWT25_00940 [Secundilactobacillus pentosiphilus]|uniref:TPR repeat-containing protein n=1 Tax=Secundilactobacillus pentosiphilus TaxID=1714682 RepID=A0A1Z5IVA9_9LACO|nr:hypothetical protein IWT25_00940 [Secundilactobacillus pentosiphilus]